MANSHSSPKPIIVITCRTDGETGMLTASAANLQRFFSHLAQQQSATLVTQAPALDKLKDRVTDVLNGLLSDGGSNKLANEAFSIRYRNIRPAAQS